MSVRIGAVILSRLGSSRLPGKALRQINNKEILLYICERLLRVFEKENIVIATSAEKNDDPIAGFARQIGIKCYRGSLENVAERFFNAAETENWDFAIRINGDNLFLDTHVLRSMVEIAAAGQYDFITNVKDRTFPKGMSIEIVRLKYYEELLPEINANDRYREHVTLLLYELKETEKHYYHFNHAFPEASGIQLALDTPEDLERSKQIIAHFTQPHWEYNMEEILKILKEMNHA
jgi:spore coat polysaccharide biosynthesis protein SpsF